ncbi:hypothetical protein CVT26_012563, partial [Gymnopilus dilepis]
LLPLWVESYLVRRSRLIVHLLSDNSFIRWTRRCSLQRFCPRVGALPPRALASRQAALRTRYKSTFEGTDQQSSPLRCRDDFCPVMTLFWRGKDYRGMPPYSFFDISPSDYFNSSLLDDSSSLLRFLLCRALRPDSLEDFVHSKDRGMVAPSWESATDGMLTPLRCREGFCPAMTLFWRGKDFRGTPPYFFFNISCSDLFSSFVSFHLRHLSCRGLRPDSLEGLVHSKDRGMAAPSQESATDGILIHSPAPSSTSCMRRDLILTINICPAMIRLYASLLSFPFFLSNRKLLASPWTPRRPKPGMAAPSMESATGK